MREKRRIATFGFAIFSFIFLFNPTIAIIDPLPDFIGYILLCRALRGLSDMNDTVSRTREMFLKMIFIDLAKIVSILFMFGLSSNKAQEMMLLLIFFAFGLVELYILIPAYKNMFSGLTNLGYKYQNVSVTSGETHVSKSYTDKASSYTFFYVAFKIIICLLPELAILVTHSEVTMERYSFLYEYMGLLRGTATMVCLVFGIVWLVRMISYFARLNKDKQFVEALEREYRETVLPKESIFIKRSVKTAFLFVGAAAFLSIDFRLDGINVFADALVAVMLILSLLAIKKYVPHIKKYLFCSVFYGMTALISDVCEGAFFKSFYYGAIMKSEEAYSAYTLMIGSSALEAIGFCLAVYVIFSLLKEVIVRYTGYDAGRDDRYAKEKKDALQRELMKKPYAVIAGAVLCLFGDLLCHVGARYIPFMALISGVCSFIFLLCVLYAVFAIIDEMNAKYMLE